MNDIARQLRAQIPSSTDPDRLEQMAREAERWTSRRTQCVESHEGEADPQHEFRAIQGKPQGSAEHLRRWSARTSRLARV
jgi:hypothetical protein